MTLDASVFNQKLAGVYDALIGRGRFGDAATVIQDKARIWVGRCIGFTPPKSLSQGRKAVARDIKRSAAPLTPETFDSPVLRSRLEDMMDKGSTNQQIESFMRRVGWKKAQVKAFSPELHKSQRDNRGRVQRSKGVFVLEVQELKKYILEIQQHVGFMKSGWVPAFHSLGGKAKAWITRHSRPSGFVANNLVGEKPSVTIGNLTKGIGQVRHAAQSALQVSANAMAREIKLILSDYGRDWKQGKTIRRHARSTPSSFYAGD